MSAGVRQGPPAAANPVARKPPKANNRVVSWRVPQLVTPAEAGFGHERV
jgi:hypothetical protein